jgi:hypothetical protein
MVQARAVGMVVALAACSGSPGELTLVQRTEAPAPLVGDGVRLYLGDVSGGASAEVRVLDRDGGVLAAGNLLRGGELGFTHGGRPWTVVAVAYKDYLLDDEGTLRVEPRPATADPTLVRVPQRGAAPVPGVPGVVVALEDIVTGVGTTVIVRDQAGAELARQRVVAGDLVPFLVGAEAHALRVEAFEDHAVDTDYAYLRLVPR